MITGLCGTSIWSEDLPRDADMCRLFGAFYLVM
jgi:hypothetical protein